MSTRGTVTIHGPEERRPELSLAKLRAISGTWYFCMKATTA
jgi:hypothetical protein